MLVTNPTPKPLLSMQPSDFPRPLLNRSAVVTLVRSDSSLLSFSRPRTTVIAFELVYDT